MKITITIVWPTGAISSAAWLLAVSPFLHSSLHLVFRFENLLIWECFHLRIIIMIFYLAEYSLFALSIISSFAPSLVRAVTYCKNVLREIFWEQVENVLRNNLSTWERWLERNPRYSMYFPPAQAEALPIFDSRSDCWWQVSCLVGSVIRWTHILWLEKILNCF